MTATKTRAAAVYRLFDSAGNLLYVGSTYEPRTRFRAHDSKPWWPLVARQEIEWLPDRQAAFAAETEAIRTECPAHNRIDGPGAVRLPPHAGRMSARMDGGEVARVLEAIGAGTEGKSPAERVRFRNAVAEAAAADRRRRNQEDVREMHEGGMTYREIAAAIGVTFGRVRQILTEELDDEGNLKSE